MRGVRRWRLCARDHRDHFGLLRHRGPLYRPWDLQLASRCREKEKMLYDVYLNLYGFTSA